MGFWSLLFREPKTLRRTAICINFSKQVEKVCQTYSTAKNWPKISMNAIHNVPHWPQRLRKAVVNVSRSNKFSDSGARPQVLHEPKEMIAFQLHPSGRAHKQLNHWSEIKRCLYSASIQSHKTIDYSCVLLSPTRMHQASSGTPLPKRWDSFAWYLWGRMLPRCKAD